MKKTDEMLRVLEEKLEAQRTATLNSATEKLRKARRLIAEEFKIQDSGTVDMEVDEDKDPESPEKCRKIKEIDAQTRVTTKKRSHGEMISANSYGYVDAGSVGEELDKQMSRLFIEAGMSFVEWMKDGRGYEAAIKDIESMAMMVGKRLSTAVAEVFYLMQYGNKSSGNFKNFMRQIGTQSAAESTIIRRRISDLLVVADHYLVQHNVEGILPELHDFVFQDMMHVLDQCSAAIIETECLLTLPNLPESPALVREGLRAIVEQLRDKEDQMYCIEVSLMEWKAIFNAYSSVAQIEMDGFISKIEDNLDFLWDDLKGRNPKRTKV